MSGKDALDDRTRRSNRVVAASCLAFFGAMIGMSYAAVPLYALFCQVTGYGGTTQRVEQYSDRILDKTITVRFDANTNGVPWDFAPEQRSVTLRIGETAHIAYRATNRGSERRAGRATFNVTPELAGAYFNKVECFCFTDTALEPGQEIEMPVVFYVDPAIVDVPELRNKSTITLSYTFFPIEEDLPQAAATSPRTTNADDKLGG